MDFGAWAWLVECLSVFLLAMPGYPCCCGDPGILCTRCESDLRAETYQIEISGFTNDTCTGCSVMNGTYIAGGPTPGCGIIADMSSGPFPPVITSLIGPTCTTSVSVSLQFDVGNRVNITWSVDVNNNETWRFRNTGDTGTEQPCRTWANHQLPYQESFTILGGSFTASRACDGTSADVRVTAL